MRTLAYFRSRAAVEESQEDFGSVLGLSRRVLKCAKSVTRSLDLDSDAKELPNDQLRLLPFYADHARIVLDQCQQEFGNDNTATAEKAKALAGGMLLHSLEAITQVLKACMVVLT